MKKNDPTKLLCVLFLLFISQSPLSKLNIRYFSNFIASLDELISILLLFYCLFKSKFTSIQVKIIIFNLSFFFIGLLSTLIFNLQPIKCVVQDVSNFLKFSATLLGIISIFSNKDLETTFINKIQFLSKYIIIVFFLLFVSSFFIKSPFIKTTEYRFGIPCLQLFYYHPAALSHVLVLLLSVLCIDSGLKSKKIPMLLALIMLVLTLRTKAICFSIIYIIIWQYHFINKHTLLKYLLFVLALFLVVYFSNDSVNKYYKNVEGSARESLLLGSISVAKDYFPLGAGLGTYGTAAAIKNYSILYQKLGFSSIYGLGYIHTNFATDSFWPGVIGEFGFIGLFIYVSFLAYILKTGLNVLKNTQDYGRMYMSLFLYLIICTSSNSGFLNPVAVPYAIFIGVAISIYQKKKRSEMFND